MSKNENNGCSTLAVIGFLVVIFLIVGGVKGCNKIVHNMSIGSVAEQGQIVLDFEKKITTIENDVDSLNKEISEELLRISENKTPNLELLEEAEETYNYISIQIEEIKIPKGLTTEREDNLKDIKTDFENSYKFKSNSMFYLLLLFETYDEESTDGFKTSASLAESNLLDAISGLVMLEKELGVMNEDNPEY